MKKKFLSFVFSFLTLSFSLMAEDCAEPLNAIYLVPDNFEYITQGESYLLQGHINCYLNNGNIIISYNGKNHFSCSFGLSDGQIPTPGVYRNAKRRNLDVGGFGRGYNQSTGEFEIFEIIYNEEGEISSFAANFIISSSDELINCIRGAVRFNSFVAVDEYLISMTDPIIKLNSPQLFYVRQIDFKSSDKNDLIAKNRINSVYLNEEHDGFDLIVRDLPFGGNKIIFHINSLSDLSKSDSFIISENQENYKSDIYWNNKNYSSPMIYLDPKNDYQINAKQGFFIISEFVYDLRNNKVISMAIDFNFKDDRDNAYEGAVRYNSTFPLILE